jgi:hypothetical protein
MNRPSEVFGAAGILMLTASVSLPAQSGPVIVGTVSVKDGTKCVTVDPAAIPSSGVSMTGDIKNDTGRKGHDISISIKPRGASGCAVPNITHVSINGAAGYNGPGAQSVNVPLGGSGQPPSFQSGGEQSFTVTLSAAPQDHCSLYDICFTMSDKDNGGGHYDVGMDYAYTRSSTSQNHSQIDHMNPGIRVWVVNNDHGDEPGRIVQLSGTVAFPGTNAIAGVALTDPDGAAVSAATSINGASFTLSSFAELQPGARYALWIAFEGIPSGPTSMSISATFE